jgi:hypothetical protein
VFQHSASFTSTILLLEVIWIIYPNLIYAGSHSPGGSRRFSRFCTWVMLCIIIGAPHPPQTHSKLTSCIYIVFQHLQLWLLVIRMHPQPRIKFGLKLSQTHTTSPGRPHNHCASAAQYQVLKHFLYTYDGPLWSGLQLTPCHGMVPLFLFSPYPGLWLGPGNAEYGVVSLCYNDLWPHQQKRAETLYIYMKLIWYECDLDGVPQS